MGVVLELAREERRADEDAGERREHGEPAQGGDPAVELALEVPDDDVAAGAGSRRQAAGERVAVVFGLDRETRRERGEREGDEQPESRDELCAVLTPRHPCHRSGTFSGGTGAGRRSGAM